MVDSPEKDDYGWFEDMDPQIQRAKSCDIVGQLPLHRALAIPPPATEPPPYILESNLETQQLWYSTAGQRPKQPSREREHFEKLWSHNFKCSSVQYCSLSPEQCRDTIPWSEFNAEIVLKGKSPFSNSVSKSFANDQITSLTVQVPQFRVVSSAEGVRHAEYLVVVSVGSHSSVTFGVWKRHSDFSRLAQSVSEFDSLASAASPWGAAGPPTRPESRCAPPLLQFKNTCLSWQCVLQRKKWFKCLDRDYLSLKCFLLERFMHDLLFESPSAALVGTFLGLLSHNHGHSSNSNSNSGGSSGNAGSGHSSSSSGNSKSNNSSSVHGANSLADTDIRSYEHGNSGSGSGSDVRAVDGAGLRCASSPPAGPSTSLCC